MHGYPYSIKDLEEFKLLVELGDYYLSLQVLSASLLQALIRSQDFVANFSSNALEILPLAVKLRNSILFKDCMIFALGPWTKPAYLDLKDSNLKQIAGQLHALLSTTLQRVDEEIMFLVADHYKPTSEIVYNIVREAVQKARHHNLIKSRYYMHVQNLALVKMQGDGRLIKLLAPLTMNRLIIGAGKPHSGEFYLHDYFFCFDIPDEMLSWDVTDTPTSKFFVRRSRLDLWGMQGNFLLLLGNTV